MSSSLPEFKRRNEEPGSLPERSVGKFGRSGERRGVAGHTTGRTYVMTLGQVLVLWSVLAASLCVAFLFGLFAGREQGVSIALDEYQRQATRLPIVEPLANLGSSEKLPNVADEILRPKAVDAPELIDAGKPAGKMDFSAESKIALPSKKVVAAPKVKAEVVAPQKSVAVPVPPVPVTPTPEPEVVASLPATTSVAKQDSSKSVSSPISGWYVQVGASPERSKAEGIAAKIRPMKLPVVLEEAFVQKRRYFRVLVGPFSNKEEAGSRRAKILKSKKISVTPFLKRVR